MSAVYSDTLEGVPSAAGNVVTALLLDPFSEDAATTSAIERRHDEVHTGGEFIVRCVALSRFISLEGC